MVKRSGKLVQKIRQNRILGPHVSGLPSQLTVPVTGTMEDGRRIVAVTHLDDHRPIVGRENKIERHALRSGPAGDVEGDFDAFEPNSCDVVVNAPAAGRSKISRTNISSKREGAVA